MYKCRYESETGKTFEFSPKSKVVFDMNLGNGVSVDLGTSQGFEMVGEYVDIMAVGGKEIEVNGVIYDNIYNNKVRLRAVFAPFTKGRLIFQDGHYINVYVKETPSFSTVRDDGKFTMLLYAPQPYFKSEVDRNVALGKIIPLYRLPINFSQPHKFGKKSINKTASFENNGNVKALFNLEILINTTSTNILITNIKTNEKLLINGTYQPSERLKFIQDVNGIKLYKLTENSTEEITYMVDDSSNFNELPVGHNVVKAIADEGEGTVEVNIIFNEGVTSIYEA